MGEVSRLATRNTLTITTAIFDESGKWKDSAGVFVFAGFVTFPIILSQICEEWSGVLMSGRIAHTSMKEAMSFNGPYEGFTNRAGERDAIVRNLATVLSANRSKMACLASPMGTATINDFKNLPTQQQKAMRGDPYYGGFEACVRGALDTRSDTQFHVVCDLAEQYSEKCVEIFHQMRKLNPAIKSRCLGIAFSDDEYYPPLQMADMLAYCHRQPF